MKHQNHSASKREYWADQFEQQKASGLSQREYCRRGGISFSQFYYWKVKGRESKRETERIVRVPIELSAAGSSAMVEILVGERFTVRVGRDVDEQHLRRVLMVLESLR